MLSNKRITKSSQASKPEGQLSPAALQRMKTTQKLLEAYRLGEQLLLEEFKGIDQKRQVVTSDGVFHRAKAPDEATSRRHSQPILHETRSSDFSPINDTNNARLPRISIGNMKSSNQEDQKTKFNAEGIKEEINHRRRASAIKIQSYYRGHKAPATGEAAG